MLYIADSDKHLDALKVEADRYGDIRLTCVFRAFPLYQVGLGRQEAITLTLDLLDALNLDEALYEQVREAL